VGAPAAVVDAASESAAARHFFEVCVASSCVAPLMQLCSLAAAECRAFAPVAVDVVMVDFEGRFVASSGWQP
jgi:hypothetical protein